MNLPESYFRAPEVLTPAERFSEIAGILARGLRQARTRCASPASAPAEADNSAETALNQLDTLPEESVYADQ